jgi:hypothetical protein
VLGKDRETDAQLWQVMRTNAPAAIAVAVVHNKLKTKDAQLPPGVVYMAGEDVPPKWYIYTHTPTHPHTHHPPTHPPTHTHTHTHLALARALSLARSLSRARTLALAK